MSTNPVSGRESGNPTAFQVSSSSDDSAFFASFLGSSLSGGWVVVGKAPGGCWDAGGFSRGFILRSANGDSAFLKLLNVFNVFNGNTFDPSKLCDLRRQFDIERLALIRCGETRCANVVTMIDAGVHSTPCLPFDVPYLVLELAECNMHYSSGGAAADASMKLAWLRQVGAAIQQLHASRIAHQDIKAANVLLFADGSAKLADLGSASVFGNTGPRCHMLFAGDPAFAPLELRYGDTSRNWELRRFGCDVFQFGGLAVDMFTGIHITEELLGRIGPGYRPGVWKGTYRMVLPHLAAAYEELLREIFARLPIGSRDQLLALIAQCTALDPLSRGFPGHDEARTLSLAPVLDVLDGMIASASFGAA